MTVSRSSDVDDVPRSYFIRRRSPNNWRGFSILPRVPQALIILAMIGALLFLWIPPAAAAPTITGFHVSNVGVPQGIASPRKGASPRFPSQTAVEATPIKLRRGRMVTCGSQTVRERLLK